MKCLFPKRSAASNANGHAPSASLSFIFRCVRPHLHRLALKFQQSSERFSKRQKLLLLALLITVAGSFNLRLLLSYFGPTSSVRFSLGEINRPLESGPFKNPFFDAELEQVKQEHLMQFKQMLDSLPLTEKGKAIYNRIIRSRPGLTDSLSLLKKIYENQHRRPIPEQYDINPKPQRK